MTRRILMYSHDTFGIGNIRRTLELCRAMTQRVPDLSILVITGAAVADTFRIPANVDYVKLPALRRTGRGSYHARAEGFATPSVRSMRADICSAAVEHFAPDLVLVDKAPFGVDGELTGALERTHIHNPACRHVLVLRDILDAGEVIRADWHARNIGQAIADNYDAVWVFGSPALFDLAREYALPAAMVRKLMYLGLMGRIEPPASSAEIRRSLGLDGRPFVLFTAGGGDDGEHLLATSSRALAGLERSEPGLQSVLVSGPLADPELRYQLGMVCRESERRHFHEYTTELTSWMNAADAVVAMGGYNTMCEILWLRKHALIVPRNHPVREQAVRARRLADLGAVRMCLPADLTPERLIAEVRHLLHDFRPAALPPHHFPFDGLARASEEAARLLAAAPGPRDQGGAAILSATQALPRWAREG